MPIVVLLGALEIPPMLSASALLEAPDVVVEPARLGACIGGSFAGDSLIGDGIEAPPSIAFSLVVTASELLRKPILYLLRKESCLLVAGVSLALSFPEAEGSS